VQSEGSALVFAFVFAVALAVPAVILRAAEDLLLHFDPKSRKAVILSDQREPKDLRLLFACR
jgi:hypothetical protein